MRCVKFSKEYIMREFPDVKNADKVHGMVGNTQHCFCAQTKSIMNLMEK
jgi:hypothetical protein